MQTVKLLSWHTQVAAKAKALARKSIRLAWVDYKIASIDDDWSGMKFARKRT